VAEHHGVPGIASGAPAVLLAAMGTHGGDELLASGATHDRAALAASDASLAALLT
jgi:hypothetical protein